MALGISGRLLGSCTLIAGFPVARSEVKAGRIVFSAKRREAAFPTLADRMCALRLPLAIQMRAAMSFDIGLGSDAIRVASSINEKHSAFQTQRGRARCRIGVDAGIRLFLRLNTPLDAPRRRSRARSAARLGPWLRSAARSWAVRFDRTRKRRPETLSASGHEGAERRPKGLTLTQIGRSTRLSRQQLQGEDRMPAIRPKGVVAVVDTRRDPAAALETFHT